MSSLPAPVAIENADTTQTIDCELLKHGDPSAHDGIFGDALIVNLGNASVISFNARSGDCGIEMPPLVKVPPGTIMTLFNEGAGTAYLLQCDQAFSLQPGSIVVVDPSYSISLSNIGEPRSQLLGVLLFRFGIGFDSNALRSLLLVPRGIVASPLDHAQKYAKGILDLGPVHDPALARLLAQHLTELLTAGLMLNTVAAANLDRARDVRRDLLFHEIDARYTDPGFVLDDLARAAGITPRYVQTLLAKDNTSFNAEVISRRLSLAREKLVSPRYQKRAISDIAEACGFASRAHFHRMFRRRFGATPMAFRERCLNQLTDVR